MCSRIFRKLLAGIALSVAVSAIAGPVDEGKKLYKNGDYEAAVELLKPVVRRSPRNGNANYWLGASLIALGRSAEARPYLEKAGERGVYDAFSVLVEDALALYDADAASEYLDKWRDKLTSARKTVPEKVGELNRRSIQLQNMLARVEKIEIIDSIVVPTSTFFSTYRLSAPAGKILPPESVERIVDSRAYDELSLAYMPENRSEILWAAADTTGILQLYGAGILDDGTTDHVGPLDESLGEGGNAAYPFLMPDGMTLYFANNGENSIGGYDIFMTRRDVDSEGTSYFQPQNMGMPYNSPYDDYLLAIDENSGLGWWATDRNQIPDSVTIYVFIPSAMRINVDADDENLAAYARISNIGITQNPDVDYHALLEEKLPVLNNDENSGPDEIFAVDMGNGKIYTRLSDFRSREARAAMVEYLGALSSLHRSEAQEETLRAKYRSGDKTVSQRILMAENESASLRSQVAALLNKSIRLENNSL